MDKNRMTREELVRHFFELTEREKYRKEHPEEGPGEFYRLLEEKGYREPDGVYHIPSIFFSTEAGGAPRTWRDRIDRSPYQALFRVKQATRFQSEPLSYADFLCVRYVYSGEVAIRTRDREFTMKKNDILLINSGLVMSQQLTHEEDVVFTLLFEREYLTRYVLNRKAAENVISRFIYSYILKSGNRTNYILFHGDQSDRIPRLIEDLLIEYTEPTELGSVLIGAYLQILFAEMTYLSCDFRQDRDSRNSYIISEILDEIDHNYQTVTLKTLAGKYSYHPDHISRMIRDFTGKSFKEYLLERRMEEVCALLIKTPLPIKEIEERAGFDNETYFYKKFREKYKMTPNEYRSSRSTS